LLVGLDGQVLAMNLRAAAILRAVERALTAADPK
jgi:hypothetical protein